MAFTPANLLIALAGLGALMFVGFTALKMLFARRQADGAFAEWRGHSPEAVEGLDAAAFRRAWLRAYGARGQLYVMAGAGAVLLASPIVLGALGLLWHLVWRATGKPILLVEGTILYGFYLFFGLILGAGGAAGIVARAYARNRPGTLEDELARARASLRSTTTS